VKNISDKRFKENQNKHFEFNNFFFFENHAIHEIMWKKVLYSRTIHRWKYGACALHIGYIKLKTHIQNI